MKGTSHFSNRVNGGCILMPRHYTVGAMDTLAHGLLTYTISRAPRRPMTPWWLLVGFGMLPDGIWIAGSVFGIPFDGLYHVSHSLVVWAALSVVGLLITRRSFAFTWPWALHILVDIPGHTVSSGSELITKGPLTPFLWPLSDFALRGWWNWLDLPWMAGTYLGLGMALGFVEWQRRRSSRRMGDLR